MRAIQDERDYDKDLLIMQELSRDIQGFELNQLCSYYAGLNKRIVTVADGVESDADRDALIKLQRQQMILKDILIQKIMKSNGYYYTEDTTYPEWRRG